MDRIKVDFKGVKKLIRKNIMVIILLAAIFVRTAYVEKLPGGLNQDEAFAGYEAYSLLNYGVDSHGYHNPVYLVAWGSGMNALNTYLMMPFIKVLGLTALAIRIPQMILACISVLVFYLLLKKIFSDKLAVIGMFLLAINPWHIMLSRWGLESNLAPAFLLFGLYFFVLGLEREKYLVLSALAYGLSLYCYAVIWMVLPFLLLFQVAYGCYYKRLRLSKVTFLSVLILGVLAAPLICFLVINTGDAGFENGIVTPLFSIPKLLVLRNSEISAEGMLNKISIFYNTIIGQNDGLPWNVTEPYGLYYKFSLPFICIGAVVLVKDLLYALKNRQYDTKWFILFQLVIFSVLGILISVNVNKINGIHLYIIILLAVGIHYIWDKISKDAVRGLLVLYSVAFIGFMLFYVENYRMLFNPGMKEALAYAEVKMEEKNAAEIYVSDEIKYPLLLFYSRTPVTEFLDTVEYRNFPSAYLAAEKFTDFNFHINKESPEENGVYVIKESDSGIFLQKGMHVENFGAIMVAH